jgi:hypothetical protein
MTSKKAEAIATADTVGERQARKINCKRKGR